MDWYVIACTDWEIYSDTSRIRKYVSFSKITEIQYTQITGEPYVK